MGNSEQLDKVRSGSGFIAALDQSGGSSAKALALYGIAESEYSSDERMFDLMHEMRARIMQSPVFNGDRVLAAILFEDTMGREVGGKPTADYLWGSKGIVPFLKVDKGLETAANGVQLMKPVPNLEPLLARAVGAGITGTKMRSVIKMADDAGIKAIVAQQFDIGRQILASGLVPILEPEVDIHSPEKAQAEGLLKAGIMEQLSTLPGGQQVIIKISIPTVDNFYADLIAHPKVLRVAALSGGYHLDEACERLSRDEGLIASFSRALIENLKARQSDEEFDAALDQACAKIYAASTT